MGVREKATMMHESGYNCAQSVFSALGEYTGLDEKTALAISGGFGGGLRCGEVCGVVSGAIMAIGMVKQYNDCTDLETKDKIAELTREFVARFSAKYPCLRCNDLKAKEISCPALIEDAAEIAESIIKEIKQEK